MIRIYLCHYLFAFHLSYLLGGQIVSDLLKIYQSAPSFYQSEKKETKSFLFQPIILPHLPSLRNSLLFASEI